MRSLGWQADPRKRPNEVPDKDASGLLGATTPLPKSASCRDLIVSVLDQGSLSSCVANATMQAIRASHVKQGAKSPKLGSRLFAYFNSRLYDGHTGRDQGTYIRTCFQSLNKFGFPNEEAWPYNEAQVNRVPKTAAYHAAFDQRSPTEYHRIYSSGDERIAEIKRAIAERYCVVFGTPVSNDFCNNNLGDGPIDPPIGKAIAGGHAMCVVGYNGDTFTIVNSWGTNWGQSGYCEFSADYLSWWQTADLWICQRAPLVSVAMNGTETT